MSIGDEDERVLWGRDSPDNRHGKGGTKPAGNVAKPRPDLKKRGRKAIKIDERAKLERSRQSARECRARKKLRYQYLEEMVTNRQRAVFALREELETYQRWCSNVDEGIVPADLKSKLHTPSPGDRTPASSPTSSSSDETIIDFSSIAQDTFANSSSPNRGSSSPKFVIADSSLSKDTVVDFSTCLMEGDDCP